MKKVKVLFKGSPGWHIECSAMSMKFLGNHFDIHCGGVDHIPVHHTNEIAQAEGITGTSPWVNYWLHGEFMVVGKNADKMAKSDDNFLTVDVIMKDGFDPLSYRYMTFQTHYRKQLQFTPEALAAAQNGLKKLREKIQSLSGGNGGDQKKYVIAFMEAINDDLNMPQALAVLQEMLSDKDLTAEEKRTLVQQFDGIFGLDLSIEEKVPTEVQELVTTRTLARNKKDFKESDRLRDEIVKRGFVVKDEKDGRQILTKK
jgi:cysteinyl-tRNA synthetase